MIVTNVKTLEEFMENATVVDVINDNTHKHTNNIFTNKIIKLREHAYILLHYESNIFGTYNSDNGTGKWEGPITLNKIIEYICDNIKDNQYLVDEKGNKCECQRTFVINNNS